jgi:hypothetical protein
MLKVKRSSISGCTECGDYLLFRHYFTIDAK